jgi:UrcA family protein
MTMNVQKLKFAALAAVAALLATGGGIAALTSPAFAAEVEAPAAVTTVRYEDINLRTAAGVEHLNARIRDAAERLCIEAGVKKSLDAGLAGLECRDTAIASAAQQVRRATGGGSYVARTFTLARGR